LQSVFIFQTHSSMKKPRIAVIGVGGQTGTMFAFELGKAANILGIGKEIELICKKKLFIQSKDTSSELFKGKVVAVDHFNLKEFFPDIIFLTVKNPIGEAAKFYYQKIKEYNQSNKMFPTLVLSQNGISAGEDAVAVLEQVFGQDYEKIQVIRLALFNPINQKRVGDKTYISYSLPIRFAFGKFSGPGNLQDIIAIFRETKFKAEEFPRKKVKDMEFSKLFLNLIGMAAATHGLSINDGFKKTEIFKEEVAALKEYIKVVKSSGGDFLNFSIYQVKLITDLIESFPIEFVLPFRNRIIALMSRGREGKAKDLTQIKYYNGAVIDLGRKAGIKTPVNKKILERVS